MMPNTEQHGSDMATLFQHPGSSSQLRPNINEFEHFAGNTHVSRHNQQDPNSSSAPIQTNPAWGNSVAPSAEVTKEQGGPGSMAASFFNSLLRSNHNQIEYFSGNMHFAGRNNQAPINQKEFVANHASPSATTQIYWAWDNHVAPSAIINKGQGSVTSQQTNSSESSLDMPSPDSVACHSVQTSPEFHPTHNSGNGNFSHGSGSVLREDGRIERRLGNHSASQHSSPETFNMVSERSFNSMADNNSVANLLEETRVKLDSNDGGRHMSHQKDTETNRKRQFEHYYEDQEPNKMSRSSQMHEARFEGSSGAQWQGNYNNQGYQASGNNSQFPTHDRTSRKSDRNDAYGPASSQTHGVNFENPAQKFGTAGTLRQGNQNNQNDQVREQDTFKNAGKHSTFTGTTSQFSKQPSHSARVYHVHAETATQSGLQKEPSALDAYFETANKTGPDDQALTGSYPQNLQEKMYQNTADDNSVLMTGNNFNPIETTSRYHDSENGRIIQQWIPDNNDNFGLMGVDWVYPEGVCDFGTYSNYVDQIDPWTGVQAERESAPSSSSVPEFHQVSNNEEESSWTTLPSLEVAAPTPGATRPLAPTQGMGHSKEDEEALVAHRAANRGYTKNHNEKVKELRESYKREAVLLPEKIPRPREYRRKLEASMVLIGEHLKKWYPGFVGHETRGYKDGMKKLRDEFSEKNQENLDSELNEARKKLAEQKQKFLDADQEYNLTKRSTAGSQKSRANAEIQHLENVCKVYDLQWTLCLENKLKELAILYFKRMMPTVIPKLNMILTDIEKQWHPNKRFQDFENFLQFLKENRRLFMVRRYNLPSGSTGFMYNLQPTTNYNRRTDIEPYLSFENSSRTECFMNTIANMIYSCKGLLEHIVNPTHYPHNSQLKDLLIDIFSKKTNSTRKWRESLADDEYHSGQQDIGEIFHFLIQDLSNELRSLPIEFEIVKSRKCNSCQDIQYLPTSIRNFSYLTLSRNDTFENLFESAYSTKACSNCKKCGGERLEKKTITHHGRYHIMVLNHMQKKFRKLNTSHIFNMFGFSWRIKSFAQYEPNDANGKSGHYKAWVDGGEQWLCINDDFIQCRRKSVDLSKMFIKLIAFEKC